MYCKAREADAAEEKLYRVYVTDALRLSGEGKYPAARWFDLIDTTPPPPVDDRPAVEIARDIIARAKKGRRGGGEG